MFLTILLIALILALVVFQALDDLLPGGQLHVDADGAREVLEHDERS